MKQIIIKIENLKCGGCANSIEMGLLALEGVRKVNVIEESSEVDIWYDEGIDLALVKNKLRQMGYPEVGSTEGFDKLTANMRSYVSCAIGKLNKKEDQEK